MISPISARYTINFYGSKLQPPSDNKSKASKVMQSFKKFGQKVKDSYMAEPKPRTPEEIKEDQEVDRLISLIAFALIALGFAIYNIAPYVILYCKIKSFFK